MTMTRGDSMNLQKKFDRAVDRGIGNALALARRNKIKLTKHEARYIALDDMFDDLSDGAYFAAMAENGYEVEDIIECNESVNEKGFYDTREEVR